MRRAMTMILQHATANQVKSSFAMICVQFPLAQTRKASAIIHMNQDAKSPNMKKQNFYSRGLAEDLHLSTRHAGHVLLAKTCIM